MTYNGGGLIALNCVIVVATLLGNILTITAIITSRKLFSIISNQFVFNLAISDIFVGITIPYNILFHLTDIGKIKEACLLRFVLIRFACASSIINLLNIAFDRYIAVLYPFFYQRCMTRKFSLCVILWGWLLSLVLSSVTIYWNNWRPESSCEVSDIIPVNHVLYLLVPCFILGWVVMLVFYVKICRVASKQSKKLENISTLGNKLWLSDGTNSKSLQVVLTIIGCFTICWLPFVIVIIYLKLTGTRLPILYEITFSMAVANSTMNPIIYAWKNTTFRNAFISLLKCQTPNGHHNNNLSYVTNHVPRANGLCNNGFEDLKKNWDENVKTGGKSEIRTNGANDDDRDSSNTVVSDLTHVDNDDCSCVKVVTSVSG